MLSFKHLGLALTVSLLAACGASELESSKANTSPVIQLNGDAEITITMGLIYEDEGATARDLKDGILPVTSSRTELAMDSLGSYSYEIIYSTTDSDNNKSTVTRKVMMVDDISPAM